MGEREREMLICGCLLSRDFKRWTHKSQQSAMLRLFKYWDVMSLIQQGNEDASHSNTWQTS